MFSSPFRQRLGQWGEKLAQNYLHRHGYLIIATNFHSPSGEIDIIAQTNGQFVFTEVKTRKRSSLQAPEEFVDKKKLTKMGKTALDFFFKNNIETENYRFDIIAIEVDYQTRKTLIRHSKAVH